MPDVVGDAAIAMARARDQAMTTAEELYQRKRAAMARGDFDDFERFATAYGAALDAEDKATKRLIAGLANPDEQKILTLAAATDELDARLERMKKSETELNDVAVAITTLVHAVLLFGMV